VRIIDEKRPKGTGERTTAGEASVTVAVTVTNAPHTATTMGEEED
jgi:hypothetical protein